MSSSIPSPTLRKIKSCKAPSMYNVISFPTMEPFAERLQKEHPGLFSRIPVKWDKFSDSGMDHIIVDGFRPTNVIKRSRVIFLADFNSNDAIMSQLHILVMLCESFIEDLIIYLPYLPVATMERIVHEGEVATANTICRILSHLPPFGRPARVMFYDLHTLQNRFYLHTNALASMHSAVPLIIDAVLNGDLGTIDAVAFPDEGAQKRFGKMFQHLTNGRLIVCGKKRVGETRKVFIQDGDCKGKRILIVDDIVKTGGTLAECAKTLKKAGAKAICAYCTHAGFPSDSARRFCKGGDRNVFEKFYVTNSNPTAISRLPDKKIDSTGVFVVLDLLKLFVKDL